MTPEQQFEDILKTALAEARMVRCSLDEYVIGLTNMIGIIRKEIRSAQEG